MQIQILKLPYQTERFEIELFRQEVLSNKRLEGIWVSAYRGNVVQNIFTLVPKIHDTGTTLQILLLIFSIFEFPVESIFSGQNRCLSENVFKRKKETYMYI